MEIKTGENKCFICNGNIPWYFNLSNGSRIEAFSIPNGKAQATAIAIDKVPTTEGNRVCYEVTVSCPYCNNKNKFKY